MGGDEEIVYVIKEMVVIFDKEGLENFFHCSTKSGRGVCESEVHHHRFVKSKWGFKSHLPSVLLLNVDVVIPPPYVKFGEMGFPLKVV